MKKLLILLLVVILSLSTLIMASCNGNSEGKKSGSSNSVSTSSSESFVKASRTTVTPSIPSFGSNSISSQPGTSIAPVLSGSAISVPTAPVDASDLTPVGIAIRAINRIGTVSSSNYKDKEESIQYAKNKCDSVSDKSQIPNYAALQQVLTMLKDFQDQGTVLEFSTAYSNLPSVENLKNAGVEAVYSVTETFNTNKTLLTAKLPDTIAAIEANLNALNEKIRNSIVETALIAQDMDGNGKIEATALYTDGKTKNEFNAEKKRTSFGTFFSGIASVSGSATDESIQYTDKLNNNVKISQYFNFTTLTFTTDCPGTFKMYSRKGSTRTYTVTQNSATLGTLIVSDSSTTDASVTLSVDIKAAGSVSVTVSGGTGYAYALVFNYPTLG